MGKRRGGGLTGLSRFVLESFKTGTTSTTSTSTVPASDDLNATHDLPSNPHEPSSLLEPPAKKRRVNKRTDDIPAENSASQQLATSKWIKKYDATGLVPQYTDASQVPDHLQKYFAQRLRYLSLYSKHPGCLLDEEGWYSITPELAANQIAERCRCDTILDAFCGVGGNAIAFAQTCQRVIALDISPTRLALARHNAQIYGVADRIEFILSDYISFANSYLSLPSSSNPQNTSRKIDVVFLSPPWGGPSYISATAPLCGPSKPPDPPSLIDKENPHYSLSSIKPIHGAELFHLSRRITKNIAYYLPRNTRLEEISALLKENADNSESSGKSPTEEVEEMVEVEEEWMGSKLKALTCYFGGLADGQGELF